MAESEKLAVGVGQVDFLFNPKLYPAGTQVILKTEVSEDGGVTWRYHGGATVDIDQASAKNRLAGTGIAFEKGNNNPDFKVRTSAELFQKVSDIPLQVGVDAATVRG